MKIEISNIYKGFNKKNVLNGVSLIIPDKKSTVILGKSGCGKSVLLKIIYQILLQDSGLIKYNSKEDVDINKFSMLFQYSALFDSLTIWENIAFQSINEKSDSIKNIKEKVIMNMESLGLSGDNFYKYPSELSGGMKKRVALGRALFKKPSVIFLDEPTTGLDPVNSALINDLIVKTVKEKGITAITITHDIKSAIKTGDIFYYLENGIAEVSGECNDIFQIQNEKLNYFLRGEI
jgi:phospholipid/cholesterol/gamma-HCH transport system ATP-binding protein